MIRIPQVRVVDEEGNQLGVMPTPKALEMAQERGFDLVEVAPMASPPVTRFLDFGQYKYELTKREKEAKRRQRVGFKEVRLSPKIGQGDFDTKVHRAIEFLEEGDRIKVTVRFRGRELTHPELGRNLLTKFTDKIKEHGVVERAPLLEGKSMHLTVASLHKPKGQEAPPKGEAPSTGEAPPKGEAAPKAQADRPQGGDAPRAEAPKPAATEPAPKPAATEPAAKPAATEPAPKPAATEPEPAPKPAAAQPAPAEPATQPTPQAAKPAAQPAPPALKPAQEPEPAAATAGPTTSNQPAAPASTGE
jgi:translation initiation factor IF-3